MAWSNLESILAELAVKLKVQRTSFESSPKKVMIEMLSRNLDLSDTRIRLLHELRNIRNKVVHSDKYMNSVTDEQASEYADAAIEMIHFLRSISKDR